MVVIRTINCLVCGETKRESLASSDWSNVCRECKEKEAGQKRLEFLAGRAALTVEERLALIEQWIYDYRPPVDPRSVVFG